MASTIAEIEKGNSIVVARRTEVAAMAIMCGTQLANVLMYSGAKWVAARSYPALEVVTFRFMFAGVFAYGLVLAWHGFRIPRLTQLGTHVLRNLFLLGSNAFSFAALAYLKLADVQAILYLSPFVTTASSVLLLHERLRPRVIPGIAIAFGGIILVLRPDAEIGVALLLALGMTVCSGFYATATRALGKSEPPAVTLLFSGIMTAIAAAIATLVLSHPVVPSRVDFAAMAAVGLAGALSQLGLIISHRMAPANMLSPFVYTQMPIALVLGFVVFGEMPDLPSLTGMIVIVAAAAWVARGSSQSRAAPAAPASEPSVQMLASPSRQAP